MIFRHKMLVITAGLVVLVLLLSLLAVALRRQKYSPLYFQKKWEELQRLCADKKNWPIAIVDADKLLDEALKRRHFRGKTMGERLVSAQHTLSNNDAVWFGHKLRSKIEQKPNLPLGKKQVRGALLGFLKALKDLNVI
jgi:hypothetical protein